MAMPRHDSVEQYLEATSDDGRAAYARVEQVVRAHAPDAEERISYGIPTFFVGGKRLLHAATWEDHLAIYPPPPGLDVGDHLHGKGTIRFPYAQEWPAELVEAIVVGHLKRIGR